MKKYNVASGDNSCYYSAGFPTWHEAVELLHYAQTHDPNAHIVEIEFESEVERLRRERDFLLGYLTNTHMAPCDICKHEPETHDINDCAHVRKVGFPCFEWRGLPEV